MIRRVFFLKLSLLWALSTTCVIAIAATRRLEPSFNLVGEIIDLQHAIRISRQDDANPQVTSCSSPSSRWLKDIVQDVSEEDLSNLFEWHLHVLPFVYKLYVAPRQYEQEYFGLDGEYTQEITTVHNQAQEFWSDGSDDVLDEIYILCAHGSDLADRHDKLIPSLELLFKDSYDSEYTVYDHADEIQELITRLPGGYNFPLLTFNAFATDNEKVDEESSIIIGDGYFQFQNALGMDSEGPEYAHTHEFAHHLQFLLGVSETQSGIAQVAKKSELMADAFSAYFLAHNQGGSMIADEISNVHSVAFSVGDCEISHEGHHGTPIQRRCATVWGAALADHEEIDKKMDIFELETRFNEWFDSVDDLDESCQHVHSAATPRSSPTLFLQAFLAGGVVIMLL